MSIGKLMSRKPKVGIDYFSHDVDMLQDIKIKLVKAKHGLIGYAVYLRLLEETYRDCGYYLKIDENFNILFSDENNIKIDEYILILNDCIDKGLFDNKLYDKYEILTSSRIQSNYCSATERRKEVTFIKEYTIIDVKELYNLDKVNVNIYPLNVDINPEIEGKSTQRKGKERKKKEIYTPAFERWFESYPKRNGRKVGKSLASPLFEKILKIEWDDLKIATENYSLECNGLPKDAERFLKKNFWKDFICKADNTGTNQDDGMSAANEEYEATQALINQ